MPKGKVVMKQQMKMPPGADEFRKLMQEAQRAEMSRPVVQIMTKEGASEEEAPKTITSEDVKRWNIIYPAFLDKGKTCAEGRRVPKEIAIENPDLYQIGSACLHLGYSRVVLELRKTYPRDFSNPGRLRVKIDNEKGEPIVPEITNMRKLLVAVAKAIPELPPPAARQLTAKEQKNAAKKAKKRR